MMVCDPESLYFTSDTHFGHKNILTYSKRPFDTIEVHDEGLIRRWNERVKPTDTIFHLGDFAFLKPDRMTEVIERLNGRIRLLLGNHDSVLKKSKRLQDLFASVGFYQEIKVPDEEMDLSQPIILFHYPIESWNKAHHGSWQLHGHCHGTLPSPDHMARVDVGVDVWDYAPVSYEEIKAHMTNKVFKPIDHHVRPRAGEDLSGFPPTGTKCSECGEPQYKTPSGEICKNAHGGAPPLED